MVKVFLAHFGPQISFENHSLTIVADHEFSVLQWPSHCPHLLHCAETVEVGASHTYTRIIKGIKGNEPSETMNSFWLQRVFWFRRNWPYMLCFIAIFPILFFIRFWGAEPICKTEQHCDISRHSYNYMDLIRTPNMRNFTFLGVFIW